MLTVLLLALIGSTSFSSEFTKYPAEAPLSGKPAPVSMKLPDARKFRTVLRSAAAEGANFNGHYRITYWGQGTGVVLWAVIDLSNGEVWFAPEEAGICPSLDLEDDGLEYFESRTDSSLFYLNDCNPERPMNRLHNTRHAYVWRKGAAVLLREESIK